MNTNDFNVSKIEKQYDDIGTMFDEMEKEWKFKHPVKSFIDNLFGGSLFGYAPHYSLTHPLELLKDAGRQVKWAWQRVYRGWDDRASWSIDYWLNDKMPDILTQLRENTQGIPMEFFESFEPDENYSYSDEAHTEAKRLWEEQLDLMIKAFKSSQKLNDYDYKNENERKRLEEDQMLGLESFVKHYGSLWD